jgi:hypothetical protein
MQLLTAPLADPREIFPWPQSAKGGPFGIRQERHTALVVTQFRNDSHLSHAYTTN